MFWLILICVFYVAGFVIGRKVGFDISEVSFLMFFITIFIVSVILVFITVWQTWGWGI